MGFERTIVKPQDSGQESGNIIVIIVLTAARCDNAAVSGVSFYLRVCLLLFVVLMLS